MVWTVSTVPLIVVSGDAVRVRGVPKIVMNEVVELVGAQTEAVFVEAMLRAAA
jgi:predicted DsbA family dithiol-disulfide isomerase